MLLQFYLLSYICKCFHVLCSIFQIHEDYDCMLNQTNIGNNNNKYYIIQVLKHQNGTFLTWNRWGRVVCSQLSD